MTELEQKDMTDYANGLIIAGTKILNEIIEKGGTGTVRTQHENQKIRENVYEHGREYGRERTRK